MYAFHRSGPNFEHYRYYALRISAVRERESQDKEDKETVFWLRILVKRLPANGELWIDMETMGGSEYGHLPFVRCIEWLKPEDVMLHPDTDMSFYETYILDKVIEYFQQHRYRIIDIQMI